MNKKYSGVLIMAILSVGCSTTTQNYKYPDVPVKQQEFNSPRFAELKRFPARYPESAAINATEGCATLEYVVTPNNDVADIKVISTTEKQFALEAAKVIKKWNWSSLPKETINEPVKIQTRFEFCLEQPNQRCEAKAAKSTCPGEDILFSRGVRLN